MAAASSPHIPPLCSKGILDFPAVLEFMVFNCFDSCGGGGEWHESEEMKIWPTEKVQLLCNVERLVQ